MSLDAYVYCDCYEKGRLREPPPPGVSLRIESDGFLGSAHDPGSLAEGLAWDHWREHLACEHPAGIYRHERLGNISLIGLIRSELQRESARFPVLLTKVLYSGSHCGDFIEVGSVPDLQRELDDLPVFNFSSEQAKTFVFQFQKQMTGLTQASLLLAKPISF